MKAVEKDRSRRYESAGAFAADIERYLSDQPVQACPPSMAYRLGKFARRNKARLMLASVVALALVVVLTVVAGSIGWMARDRAERQDEGERRAQQALADADRLVRAEEWSVALSLTDQAEAILHSSGGGQQLLLQASRLRQEIDMARRVEEIQVMKTGQRGFNWPAYDAAYGAAFEQYGLDVDVLGAEEAAGRILSSPIWRQLVGALDDWAYVRKQRQRAGAQRRLALARAADPDRWRNRLRDALEEKESRALEEVVRSAAPDDWPAQTLVLLGTLAYDTAVSDRAIALLQRAQQQRPSDFWINEQLGILLFGFRPPRAEEAAHYFAIAVALRPRSGAAHHNLGASWAEQGKRPQAIAEFRQALAIDPDSSETLTNLGLTLGKEGRNAEALPIFRDLVRRMPENAWMHCDLGNCLCRVGQLDEAIAELREAIRLQPKLGKAHSELGIALHDKGRIDEAIAEYYEAIRLDKKDAEGHNGLGVCFYDRQQLDDAIAEFRTALRLKKEDAKFHSNLGLALKGKGQLDDAIAEFRDAVRLGDAPARYNLGIALTRKGRLDEAIAELREAVQLNQGEHKAKAHANLGSALLLKGRPDEAVAQLREALRLMPGTAEIHANLAQAYLLQKRFADAGASYRRGLDLLPPAHALRPRLSQRLRECEHLLGLEQKLSQALAGKGAPADVAERLEWARFCQDHKGRYADAARWYAEAFTAEPKLADDLRGGHRYNAACAAALAGCGQGEGAGKLGDRERARLRRQAQGWLRSELTAWGQLLDKQPDQARPAVQQMLRHWQQDPDLAGVRGEALAKLPEAERQGWAKLWADVENTLHKAQGRRPTKEPS